MKPKPQSIRLESEQKPMEANWKRNCTEIDAGSNPTARKPQWTETKPNPKILARPNSNRCQKSNSRHMKNEMTIKPQWNQNRFKTETAIKPKLKPESNKSQLQLKAKHTNGNGTRQQPWWNQTATGPQSNGNRTATEPQPNRSQTATLPPWIIIHPLRLRQQWTSFNLQSKPYCLRSCLRNAHSRLTTLTRDIDTTESHHSNFDSKPTLPIVTQSLFFLLGIVGLFAWLMANWSNAALALFRRVDILNRLNLLTAML